MAERVAVDALADAENPNITVIFQTEAGFAFFNPIKAGAEDAAEGQGATVNFQYGNGNPDRIKSLYQAALAAQPDGVALTIIDSDAFDDEICALVEAGIPVIAYNVDDAEGANGNCRMAFIGQDFAVKVFLDSDERRVGDDARRCRRETVLAAVRDAVDFRAAPVYGPVSAAPAKRRRFRRSRSRHFGQGRARSGRSAGGCGSIAVHFA